MQCCLQALLALGPGINYGTEYREYEDSIAFRCYAVLPPLHSRCTLGYLLFAAIPVVGIPNQCARCWPCRICCRSDPCALLNLAFAPIDEPLHAVSHLVAAETRLRQRLLVRPPRCVHPPAAGCAVGPEPAWRCLSSVHKNKGDIGSSEHGSGGCREGRCRCTNSWQGQQVHGCEAFHHTALCPPLEFAVHATPRLQATEAQYRPGLPGVPPNKASCSSK